VKQQAVNTFRQKARLQATGWVSQLKTTTKNAKNTDKTVSAFFVKKLLICCIGQK
jgi:hypothetical protein